MDHKPNRPDERGRIEALGGEVLFLGVWRVQGQLAVSRAIGDKQLKEWVCADPEIRVEKRSSEHHYAILATDGVWDVLNCEEAADLVWDAANDSSVHEAASILVTQALQVRRSCSRARGGRARKPRGLGRRSRPDAGALKGRALARQPQPTLPLKTSPCPAPGCSAAEPGQHQRGGGRFADRRGRGGQ